MPLILCECALHQSRQIPPSWTLLIKAIFKFTLALKKWLVCTIFFATNLSHLRTHSSKNYSHIFPHAFTLISSIILFTNTLRMKNQSIQSTLQCLHFTPTIQLTFLNYFFFFLQLLDFYHKDGTANTKRPPAENDRRPERRPEALNYPNPALVG